MLPCLERRPITAITALSFEEKGPDFEWGNRNYGAGGGTLFRCKLPDAWMVEVKDTAGGFVIGVSAQRRQLASISTARDLPNTGGSPANSQRPV